MSNDVNKNRFPGDLNMCQAMVLFLPELPTMYHCTKCGVIYCCAVIIACSISLGRYPTFGGGGGVQGVLDQTGTNSIPLSQLIIEAIHIRQNNPYLKALELDRLAQGSPLKKGIQLQHLETPSAN